VSGDGKIETADAQFVPEPPKTSGELFDRALWLVCDIAMCEGDVDDGDMLEAKALACAIFKMGLRALGKGEEPA
jgi:hypothetical protein